MLIWQTKPTGRCYLQWDQCLDIHHLVTGWAWSRGVREACRFEANKQLGEKLQYPEISFREYYTRDPSISTGFVSLVENRARAKNLPYDVRLECRIDLRRREVMAVRQINQLR